MHEKVEINIRERFLEPVSKTELYAAQCKLDSYSKNKNFFRLDQFRVENGIKIDAKWQHTNQRRSYFSDCTIANVNFTNTGFTGSIFYNCIFNYGMLQNTIFNSCNFTKCNFFNDDGKLKTIGTNFNNAVFVECNFDGLILDSCMASDALFENVTFRNCTFLGMLWEFSEFRNVTFDNCVLKGLNFEMCLYENMHMNNIRLLFPTIPYIINGIKYLKETADDVTISSAQSLNGKMTKEEYISLIPTLELFYRGTKNYFPLANILISENKFDEAYSAIISGIKVAISLRAFKSLKSYCKLLNTIKGLSPKHYENIYEVIQTEIEAQFFTNADFYVLGHYLGEVRSLLINGNGGVCAGLTIKTAINDNEYEKLGILISVLNSIIDSNATQANNYLEIRHNSPYTIFCQVISSPDTVISIIAMVYAGLLGVDTLYKKYKENKNNHLKEEQTKVQIELIKAQTKQIELDNRIKLNEFEAQQKKIDKAQEKLSNTYITINSISHNITSKDIINCDTIFYSHSEKRDIP